MSRSRGKRGYWEGGKREEEEVSRNGYPAAFELRPVTLTWVNVYGDFISFDSVHIHIVRHADSV